jgi:outer membrane protein assembly factor BamD
METEQYDLAAIELRDFVDAHPKSDLVDNASYLAALCYLKEAPRIERDQTETAEALSEFNLLLRKYPDTDVRQEVEQAIREARSRLAEKEYANGQLYFKMGDYKSARIYFDLVISDYGDTSWAEAARLAKGLAFEREGSLDDARRLYEQMVADGPEGSSGQEAARRLRRIGGSRDVGTGTESAE